MREVKHQAHPHHHKRCGAHKHLYYFRPGDYFVWFHDYSIPQKIEFVKLYVKKILPRLGGR
jgi:hypothetical protein